MQSRPVVFAAVLGLVLAACSGESGTGPNPGPGGGGSETGGNPVSSASVATGASTFNPATVNLLKGGTVTWSFGSIAHDVVFQSMAGAPQDIPVTSNAQVSRTFNTTGSFPYACTLHAGMNGTIRVQ